MTDIRAFLIDLFEDLRARRLLPVAVLLIAGLVAVPVLLSKKAEEPAVPPVEPAATESQANEPKGPEALAQVTLDDFEAGTGSSLSAFDADNPFSPPERVIEAARREAGGDTGLPTGTEPLPGGDTGGTGTGDTGTGTGDTGTGDTGDTGDTPDGGGGETETTEFTYVIDVTFWANGRKRSVESMEKLDMLPSAAAPLLIFTGVTEGGGNAVFLVDSTLQSAGEGKCQPSGDECAFLYLGAGSEQEFTNDDGDSYRLRIDEIRRVKVGDESGTASDRKGGKAAHAAVGSPGPTRRFVLPVLTDVVLVSGPTGSDSTGDDERR